MAKVLVEFQNNKFKLIEEKKLDDIKENHQIIGTVINLNLYEKWFKMIKSGKKKEEYREIKEYYDKIFSKLKGQFVIAFANGFKKTRDVIYVRCNKISKGKGKKEWGAPNELCYVLNLKEVICTKDEIIK